MRIFPKTASGNFFMAMLSLVLMLRVNPRSELVGLLLYSYFLANVAATVIRLIGKLFIRDKPQNPLRKNITMTELHIQVKTQPDAPEEYVKSSYMEVVEIDSNGCETRKEYSQFYMDDPPNRFKKVRNSPKVQRRAPKILRLTPKVRYKLSKAPRRSQDIS